MIVNQISDLKLFTQLVAAGSLSKAAKVLDSSTPAMSRRLNSIEARLGVRLIERNARNFKLTEEGALLHERAVRILRDVEYAEAEASAKGNAIGGILRIGAPNELGRRFIAPLLAQFREIYPSIEILLVLSDAGLDPAEDDLDIVLRNGMPTKPTIVVRKLLTSRRIVCATPDYISKNGKPIKPDDLLLHDCIRLVRGRQVFDQWPFIENETHRTVNVRGTLSSSSGEVLHDWIIAGKGIGLKALWDIANDLKDGKLIELLHPYWCDEIYLYACFPSHSQISKRVRVFTNFLSDAIESIDHSTDS